LKSREVLKLLGVTRQTLVKYVELGYISASKLPNGRYDYDRDSVYKFLNKKNDKYICAYIKNEYYTTKPEIRTKIEHITTYCGRSDITLTNIYMDTFSKDEEISENSDFLLMLDNIIASRIACLIILSEDDIQGIDINIFRHILKECACKLIILKS